MVTDVSTASPSPNPQAPNPEETSATPPPNQRRDDVEQICSQLADRIIGNGSRTPTISDKWRTEARLLIDRDGRPFDEIVKVIDWCQQDSFWKANILSMPKLREQYDRLRLAMSNRQPRSGERGYGHKPYINPAPEDCASAYDPSKL